jgi:hypothetical protein
MLRTQICLPKRLLNILTCTRGTSGPDALALNHVLSERARAGAGGAREPYCPAGRASGALDGRWTLKI